jgi:hypothetical protein
MKRSSFLNAMLAISGLSGIAVGCAMLLIPAQFHATAGIVLGNDVNLLNEMRASGGALLGAGIVITLGTFVSRLKFTGAILATTLYLSYGLSRLLSLQLDGTPGPTLLVVAAAEITIGAFCAIALLGAERNR